MSTARKKKDSNINIRAAVNEKDLIKHAADVSGLDTSAFMLFHSIKAAKEALSQAEEFVISREDSETFVNTLLNPPPPSKELKRAFKRYSDTFSTEDQDHILKLEFRTLDKTQDRDSFDCGIEELNTFLKKEARQQQKSGFNVTFTLVDAELTPPKIMGFYSIMNATLRIEDLPDNIAKKLPKHPIPAARIGRLARDLSTKGQGIGELLMVDALKRIKRLSAEIGCFCVIVDAKGEAAKKFYEKFKFHSLKGNELALYLPVKSIPEF